MASGEAAHFVLTNPDLLRLITGKLWSDKNIVKYNFAVGLDGRFDAVDLLRARHEAGDLVILYPELVESACRQGKWEAVEWLCSIPKIVDAMRKEPKKYFVFGCAGGASIANTVVATLGKTMPEVADGDAVRIAAAHGHVDLLQNLLELGLGRDCERALTAAAGSGHEKVVSLLLEKCGYSEEAVLAAVEEAVEYCEANVLDRLLRHCKDSIDTERPFKGLGGDEAIDWSLTAWGSVDDVDKKGSKIASIMASAGVPSTQWSHNRQIMDGLARAGAHSALQVLLSMDHGDIGDRALEMAALSGRPEAVTVVINASSPPPDIAQRAFHAALENGHTAAALVIHKATKASVTASSVLMALRGGSIEATRYVWSNGGEPYKEEITREGQALMRSAAVRTSDLADVLGFAQDLGIVPDESALIAAAEAGRCDNVRVLHGRGVPITREACLEAAYSGNVPMLMLLNELGGIASCDLGPLYIAGAKFGCVNVMCWMEETLHYQVTTETALAAARQLAVDAVAYIVDRHCGLIAGEGHRLVEELRARWSESFQFVPELETIIGCISDHLSHRQ